MMKKLVALFLVLTMMLGGVALAGLATLTTSRILAVRQAREYDLILFPAALPGGGGLTVSLQF